MIAIHAGAEIAVRTPSVAVSPSTETAVRLSVAESTAKTPTTITLPVWENTMIFFRLATSARAPVTRASRNVGKATAI